MPNRVASAGPPRTLCHVCGGKWCGVEYCLTSQDYDGVSEWVCERCGVRVGRWSGVVLAEGEIERRYGGKPIKEAPPWLGQ